MLRSTPSKNIIVIAIISILIILLIATFFILISRNSDIQTGPIVTNPYPQSPYTFPIPNPSPYSYLPPFPFPFPYPGPYGGGYDLEFPQKEPPLIPDEDLRSYDSFFERDAPSYDNQYPLIPDEDLRSLGDFFN